MTVGRLRRVFFCFGCHLTLETGGGRGQRGGRLYRQKRCGRLVTPRQITGFKSRIFSGFMIEEILMKTSRFSEPQILAILRQAEGMRNVTVDL